MEDPRLKVRGYMPCFVNRGLVKKKHNLITKGLTSELFLLAFLEPDNIRKLAQRLQNTSGNPTNYAKASTAIHSLTISKYLKHKDDGKYHPNVPKIIEELEQILKSKNESFTEDDKKFVSRFLQNRQVLQAISLDIIEKIQTQPKGTHNVDALDVLCERIGSMSAIWLTMRNNNSEWKSAAEENQKLSYSEIEEKFDMFDELTSKHSPFFETEMKKYFEKIPQLKNNKPVVNFFTKFFDIMSSAMPMFMAPESLLRKLAKLWKHYEGFSVAEHVFTLKKEKKK